MPFSLAYIPLRYRDSGQAYLDDKMMYRLHLDAGDYENRFFLMFNETQYPDVEGIFNAYVNDGKLQIAIEGIGKENVMSLLQISLDK